MNQARIPLTLVHHVGISIACPADDVWHEICAGVGEGERFRQNGYTIEPLGESAEAPLGGYRMSLTGPHGVDERICRITERDEDSMRLSLRADYLGEPAGGTIVFATYSVAPVANGSVFRIDCHSALDREPEVSPADLAAQYQAGLEASLQQIKTTLEQRASDSPTKP